MRIISLKYENTQQGWGFEKIDFFDLTLLVGVSGVGKTQILSAITSLKEIACGESAAGVKWEMEFEIANREIYTWKGEFENISLAGVHTDEFVIRDNREIKPRILFEQLEFSKDLLVERNSDHFHYESKMMPKLNSSESALFLLKEEVGIIDIQANFKQIIFTDNTKKRSQIPLNLTDIEFAKKLFTDFYRLKNSYLDTYTKLIASYYISKNNFDQIIEKFIEVFPQIEEVRIILISNDNYFENSRSEYLDLQFKEHDVQQWIPRERMSSGMFRTLLHIAEMYLSNDGTVILIDEFENSLGVNCIDVLTEDILYSDRKIQFIATSHHPYIINKIPFKYWKIVTRNGGLIKTFDAKDFDFGKSHHEQFISLINHPYYRTGKA